MSRAEEAARRAELAANACRAESKQAQVLIDRFRAEAVSAESRPIRCGHPLQRAERQDRQGRLVLRKNQSLAIGEDGSYYILTVPGGLRERLTGVKLKPSPPRWWSARAARRRVRRPGRVSALALERLNPARCPRWSRPTSSPS